MTAHDLIWLVPMVILALTPVAFLLMRALEAAMEGDVDA